MASHDITAEVAEVGERLSCAYRRTPQVTLKANGLGSVRRASRVSDCLAWSRSSSWRAPVVSISTNPAWPMGKWETGHTKWGLDSDRGARHCPRRSRRW